MISPTVSLLLSVASLSVLAYCTILLIAAALRSLDPHASHHLISRATPSELVLAIGIAALLLYSCARLSA